MDATPAFSINDKIGQLKTLLSEHNVHCGTLYEAMAHGTLTAEMQSEATKMMDQANQLAIEIMRDGSILDAPDIVKTLQLFHSHCDEWDIVDDKGANPVKGYLEAYKGSTIFYLNYY